jgi:hypothetical protein
MILPAAGDAEIFDLQSSTFFGETRCIDVFSLPRGERAEGRDAGCRRSTESSANRILGLHVHADVGYCGAAHCRRGESMILTRIRFRAGANANARTHCGDRVEFDCHIADTPAALVAIGRHISPSASEIQAGRGASDEYSHGHTIGARAHTART